MISLSCRSHVFANCLSYQCPFVALGLRLLLHSPKCVSEMNQELDLKVETAKQQIRIVAIRRMRYSNMWD